MNNKCLLLTDFYQGRVLNFAHRGARRVAPENTLPAFELAANMGAHGIEFDVWPCADGNPVVIHDSTVNRTTNGTGVVTKMHLAELLELNADTQFQNKFAKTQIPTLVQVFETFREKLLFNIELKPLGVGPAIQQFAAIIAGLISEFNLEKQVIVSSFNPISLRYMQKLAPQIALGFLTAPGFPLHMTSKLLAHPLIGYHEARHPHFRVVNSEYMCWAQRANYRVNVWTVNEIAEMKRLRDLGVDMLITDVTDLANRVLNNEL